MRPSSRLRCWWQQTTDEKIAKETNVARDDIREVRVASGRREAASTLLGDSTSDNIDKVSDH
jgi:hypothetical protein